MAGRWWRARSRAAATRATATSAAGTGRTARGADGRGDEGLRGHGVGSRDRAPLRAGGEARLTPFVIFALPRCRTKWLSVFLSYGDWHAGHDEARHCRSLDDVRSWLAQPCTGTVETSCSAFWRLLPPDVRVVTLRRPVADVVASLHRGGLSFDEPGMTRFLERAERKLDQIEKRMPGVLALTYADLATEAGCARVFERCLGLPREIGRAWCR